MSVKQEIEESTNNRGEELISERVDPSDLAFNLSLHWHHTHLNTSVFFYQEQKKTGENKVTVEPIPLSSFCNLHKASFFCFVYYEAIISFAYY